MSAQQKAPAKAKRRGIGEIVKGGPPIVGLTAYTAPIAGLLDPHVDFLLVGDSLGMVVYGFDSTLPVTVEMMVAHGAAVTRATARALVVVDLPFGGYQESPEQAFRNAARIMALTGCAAVKLEGGAEMAQTVRFLVRRGVPVMGHVGLMPQRVNTAGGFKVQGRGEEQAERVAADAAAIAEAGAFAIVIEGTIEKVARAITRSAAGADDRDRRVPRLRRPDPGDRRCAGRLHRVHPALRQALRRIGAADLGRRRSLRRRRPRPPLPRPGALLRQEIDKLLPSTGISCVASRVHSQITDRSAVRVSVANCR